MSPSPGPDFRNCQSAGIATVFPLQEAIRRS
jgi:hypothetical protein